MVLYQDVLRLEVPMVNPNGVAKLYGVEDLEKDTLDELVIADIPCMLGDVGEEVTLGTILDHDKGAVRGIHDLDQGDDVGMLAGMVVELDLPLLELALLRIEADLVERLDGIHDPCVDVLAGVDDAIGADAKDGSKTQTTGKDLAEAVFGRAKSIPGWGRSWRGGQHPGCRWSRELQARMITRSRTGVKR